MEKADIKSLTLPELEAFANELGQPAFRGRQLYEWLHKKQVQSFEQMSNLPGALRAALEEKTQLSYIKIKKKLVSAVDGTVKYLYELPDGNCVESVLMQYKHGASLCVSTQVGCRMGCGFCASTLGGLVRNLSAAEILEQVYATARDSGHRIGSIVLMGIGEPLDNFENVVRFLRILSSPEGLGMSLRHVSLSTCGLVDKMDELAALRFPLTLSVSLHAPNNEIRKQTMPIAGKWDMSALLGACKRYFEATGRRISFEYALISGVNDSPTHANELVQKLRGSGSHVNLIPVNPVRERGFRQSGQGAVFQFQQILQKAGITATVRRTLGSDINAACGQLRREDAKKEGEVLD